MDEYNINEQNIESVEGMAPRQCNGTLYTIEKGDTLYNISKRYHIPLAILMKGNPYVDVYNLQIGEQICIPRWFGSNMPAAPGEGPMPLPMPSVPSAPSEGPMPLPTPSVPSMPSEGPMPLPTPSLPSTPSKPLLNIITYVIKTGDTIREILERYDIDLEDLLKYNDLSGIMLRPGMTIKIPTSSIELDED